MNLNERRENNPLLRQSKQYSDNLWSVIPVWGHQKLEQFKVATCSWTPFMHQRATDEQLHYWFATCQYQGIGIITGDISGIAVLDFDRYKLYRLFCEQFPDLANTYIVKTPRGWHLYFRIPRYCQTSSRQTDGIDWQWQGRYVVAPPTVGYCAKNSQNPRLLTQQDITHIENFISAQKPVTTLPEPLLTDQLITSHELTAYYGKHATHGNRNNALFTSALIARDHGWSVSETLSTLTQLHVHNGYEHENQRGRQREAQATIQSAFSRPPRQLSGPRQLPYTLREHLLEHKQTGIIRVIEGLRLQGYVPGTYVSWQDAWQALKGIVGRDTILTALNTTTEQGRALFEKITGYENPSPEPPTTDAEAATLTSNDKDTLCKVITISKSGKSQTMGAPTHYFRMPSNVELARILGVRLSSISDVLTLEDLRSAKTTRQALHRGFIARKPGKYSNSWLSTRLGISKATKHRYDRAIPDLHKTPTYVIKPIYWHNLDEITEEFEVRGQFLEDEAGKRYPPKRVIAIRLLKQNVKLRLMTRDVNYYWVGHRFAVDTTQQMTVIVNNTKVSDTDFSDYWKDFYGRQAVSKHRTQSEQAKTGDLTPTGSINHTTRDTQTPHNGYDTQQYNPMQPFADAYLEEFTKSLKQALNQMSDDTRKHISLRNARRLVATYGLKACKRHMKYLKQRPAETVDSPVGLLTVMLRSNQVKENLATSSA